MAPFWFFLTLIFCIPVFSQDERYFRQIIQGNLPGLTKDVADSAVQTITITGANYKLDLNGDGTEETIQPLKIDGVDWIEIRNSSETKVFSGKLPSSGSGSSLYKIKVVNVSDKVKTLILFLDEGKTGTIGMRSVARIFLLTFENNNLETMKLVPGPHHFDEKMAMRDVYWRRDYQVNVYDIDDDGVREISVQYNHIQRIMKYVGKGDWTEL